MKYNVILLLCLFLLTGSYCERSDTNEAYASYPNEEKFDSDNEVAFYLNDLLWVTQGENLSSSIFGTYLANAPEFSYFYDTLRQQHTMSISSRMTFVKEGLTTFDQRFRLFLRHDGDLPATVQLDSNGTGSFEVSDRHQRRSYETDSNHNIRLEITQFDALNRRIEGFFEGSLKREDDTNMPVTISNGRFAFTY